MLYFNKYVSTGNTSYWLSSRRHSVNWNYFGKGQLSQEFLEVFFLIINICNMDMWMNKTLWTEGDETLWVSQLLVEVRSRLASEHDRISYSTWRCSQPVSPCVTLCSCFSHHLQLLMGPPLYSHLFSLLQPFPLIPLLLHHSFLFLSVPGLVHAGMSPDTWKQQDFPGGWCWQGVSVPPRPISPTSCASLHSSPAMPCSLTTSTTTRSECCRPLGYRPTPETTPARSEQ